MVALFCFVYFLSILTLLHDLFYSYYFIPRFTFFFIIIILAQHRIMGAVVLVLFLVWEDCIFMRLSFENLTSIRCFDLPLPLLLSDFMYRSYPVFCFFFFPLFCTLTVVLHSCVTAYCPGSWVLGQCLYCLSRQGRRYSQGRFALINLLSPIHPPLYRLSKQRTCLGY